MPLMHAVCQLCKQAKATVFVTDVPEKQVRHFCEKCAEREGVIVQQTVQTTNQILQQFIKHKTESASDADELKCPKCGTTFLEFRKRGQLGCPHDYEAFQSALNPLIERAHQGSLQHTGKVPATAGEIVRRQSVLARLQRELAGAIESEDYERAAMIRDQIQVEEDQEKS